jgi:phage major head subunit gpT-like protein
MTSAEHRRLFDENLKEVAEDAYNDVPEMIPTLFNVQGSDSVAEEYYNIGGVPDIPAFTGKLTYLNQAPGYHTKIEPKEYAAGLQYERKLIDDKKFGVMNNGAAQLGKAAARTKEKDGTRAFANAFSSAFDFMKSEEGVALCSSSHTTKSGTSTTTGFDNAGTSALTKTSVAATRILMRKFRNDISQRIDMSDSFGLILPDDLADKAEEINYTPKGLDTANGNINPQHMRYKIIPHLRLSDYSTTTWYMVNMDMMKDSLIWINRIMPDFNATTDFENYTKKVSVYMRYAYGFIDWRWIYGHNV